MKKQKGSLTVEAIISFTAFLMASFLMLHLVKLTMISLALNNATAETAKQLATAAYPIAWVNSQQAATEKKMDKIAKEGIPLSRLLGTEGGNENAAAFFLSSSPLATSWDSMVQQLMANGVNAIEQIFYDLKGKVGQVIAAQVLNGYLEASGLPFDRSRVRLLVVKLPQTDAEFQTMGNFTLPGKKDTLTLTAGADGAFGQDDVVICTAYDYALALPMLPKVELTLRSTAIEHAWLHGCQARTNRKEGLTLDIFQNKVYVATGGYGKKYHRSTDCPSFGNAYDTTPIDLAVAKSRGFEPCRTCKP